MESNVGGQTPKTIRGQTPKGLVRAALNWTPEAGGSVTDGQCAA